jgi:hypothetical protein
MTKCLLPSPSNPFSFIFSDKTVICIFTPYYHFKKINIIFLPKPARIPEHHRAVIAIVIWCIFCVHLEQRINTQESTYFGVVISRSHVEVTMFYILHLTYEADPYHIARSGRKCVAKGLVFVAQHCRVLIIYRIT